MYIKNIVLVKGTWIKLVPRDLIPHQCNYLLEDKVNEHYNVYYVKRRDVTRWKQGYITPLSHTSFCETQWRHSVKTRLYKNPPTYFIVSASSVKTKEVEVIEFHRIRDM